MLHFFEVPDGPVIFGGSHAGLALTIPRQAEKRRRQLVSYGNGGIPGSMQKVLCFGETVAHALDHCQA